MSDDATVRITGSDGSVVVHRPHHQSFEFGSFLAGIVVTLLVLWLIRRRAAKLVREAVRDHEPAVDRDFAELARRTATLERIVTEPAMRLTKEIDALR